MPRGLRVVDGLGPCLELHVRVTSGRDACVKLVVLHSISTPSSLRAEIWFSGAARLYRNLRSANLIQYCRGAKAATGIAAPVGRCCCGRRLSAS